MSEKAPKKKSPARKSASKRKATKKPKAEKAEKEEVRVEVVPLGEVPTPMVTSRHRDLPYERQGRGFSFGELAGAGVAWQEVRRLSIPVDIRRRSTLEANVQSLKGWYKVPEKKAAKEPPAEKPAKTTAKRAKKAASKKE